MSGTDHPGIARLSIGSAGLDPVLIGQGLLDAQGGTEAMLSGLGGLPDNLTFYFQGLTFDGSQGLFDESNVASALSFTHFQ